MILSRPSSIHLETVVILSLALILSGCPDTGGRGTDLPTPQEEAIAAFDALGRALATLPADGLDTIPAAGGAQAYSAANVDNTVSITYTLSESGSSLAGSGAITLAGWYDEPSRSTLSGSLAITLSGATTASLALTYKGKVKILSPTCQIC